jgi:uncharacterized surface protein with fasciclin (FAS1) repeats
MKRFAHTAPLLVAVPAIALIGLGCSHTMSQSRTEQSHKPVHSDIVQVASSAGQFKTLVAAVQAAGLVDTLKSDGPFTVFAPTDEAFAKLPAGTVENLLKPENRDQLQAILTYHVVPGKLTADHVVKTHALKTVQGGTLTVASSGKHVHVGGAVVESTDIMARNGVIHVIDTVLLPGG